MLLETGVLKAAGFCSQVISEANGAFFQLEHFATEDSDYSYVGNLGGKTVILIEAKSPSIMKKMSESLPVHRRIKLNWGTDEPLTSRILQKVSTHVFKHNTNLDNQYNCIGCSLLGTQANGVALPHKP